MEEDDDLIVTVVYRINRRPPFQVTWNTTPVPSQEDSVILYNAISAALKASRAQWESIHPTPSHKM